MGLLITVFTLPGVFLTPVAGVLSDRYGCRTTHYTGSLSSTLWHSRWSLRARAGLYPAIGGALATFGWFYLFALSILAIPIALLVLFSLLNEAAPTENRGAFMSLNSTILRLGQTLRPVLMSAAAIPFGLDGAYFAVAALAAAMLLVAFALIR